PGRGRRRARKAGARSFEEAPAQVARRRTGGHGPPMMTEINSKAELIAQGVEVRARGALAGAERLFLGAAELDPKDPGTHLLLGITYEVGGAFVEAERHYRRALELEPDATATARALGQMLLSLGRYPEGFAMMEARHAEAGYAKPQLDYPEWTGG